MPHNPLTPAENRGAIMVLTSLLHMIETGQRTVITATDILVLRKGLEESK